MRTFELVLINSVLFMTLGQCASVGAVLRELTNVLAVTGATAIVVSVKGSISLREAVEAAVRCFRDGFASSLSAIHDQLKTA